MKPYIEFEEDTGLSNNEMGPFRSYTLTASGGMLFELIDSAQIVEVDQDGGEHAMNPIYDYSDRVISTCERMIAERYLAAQKKGREAAMSKRGAA